jgi:hypothetical protein
MKRLFERLGLTLFCMLAVSVAYASDANTVQIGGFWADVIRPYVVDLISALLTVFISAVLLVLKQKLGLDVDAKERDALHSAAMSGALQAVAKLDGPLGDVAINVGNPMVASGVEWAMKAAPDAIKHFGMSPDDVAALVQAKLGQLQMSHGVAPQVALPQNILPKTP